jgi:hypothetical protein
MSIAICIDAGIYVAENGNVPTKITIAHNIIFGVQGGGARTACGITSTTGVETVDFLW